MNCTLINPLSAGFLFRTFPMEITLAELKNYRQFFENSLENKKSMRSFTELQLSMLQLPQRLFFFHMF